MSHIDLLADAREWLADEAIGGRLQTHSGECHRWHPACLVSRLLRELDSRAGSTGDSDADHPERENADHDAAPTARVSDRQCAGHADIGGTIPDAEPVAIACDRGRTDKAVDRPAGTGNKQEPVAWLAFATDGSESSAVYMVQEQAQAAADEWGWSIAPLYCKTQGADE